MPYAVLNLPPGVSRNGTLYQQKGRWYEANLVRWSEGVMQPVGGWTKLVDTTSDAISVTDPIRGLHGWRDNSQTGYLALGVFDKAHAYAAGVLTDITIAGFTAGKETAESSAGGYGVGAYGLGNYNEGASAAGTTPITEANSWQFDNFGEELIANAYNDGRIFKWDLNVSNNLVLIDAGAPTSCRGVVVTPQRFVVGLGGTDYNAASAADRRRVTWCDQENYGEWDPLAAGSDAGDFILSGAGEIMCGRRSRNETLIFTDVDLHSMKYIGGTLVYRFDLVGNNCGIISRRAVAMVDGRAYWMSHRGFYMYDGFAKPIYCDIADDIFNDMNVVQASKIAAWPNSAFHEIWFAYCSAGSSENDRIAVFNYLEKHWSGPWKLTRTDGMDRNVFGSPVMADSEGAAYFHESGAAMLDEDDATDLALTVSAESGPFEIGKGDRIVTVNRYIPDENTVGDVSMTLFASLYPTADEVSQSLTVGSISDARLTGRQVRIKLAQVQTGWRFGSPRLEIMPRGRR